MDQTTAAPIAAAAEEHPETPRHPCPRCKGALERETQLLCSTCWKDVPRDKHRRWCQTLLSFQANHPAALAILAWATPDSPPPRPAPRPAHKSKKQPPRPFFCRGCKKSGLKTPRGVLARLLRELLAEGTPKAVRERAELVARRLEGLCEKCAAAAGEGS